MLLSSVVACLPAAQDLQIGGDRQSWSPSNETLRHPGGDEQTPRDAPYEAKTINSKFLAGATKGNPGRQGQLLWETSGIVGVCLFFSQTTLAFKGFLLGLYSSWPWIPDLLVAAPAQNLEIIVFAS